MAAETTRRKSHADGREKVEWVVDMRGHNNRTQSFIPISISCFLINKYSENNKNHNRLLMDRALFALAHSAIFLDRSESYKKITNGL